MDETNIRIVQESVDQIINHKRFDRIRDYYSDNCVFHNPPYVGLGLMSEAGPDGQIVIRSVAPTGPAAGKVQPGDVLLCVRDADRTWEGSERLRSPVWGQGKLGTEVTLTCLRDGSRFETAVVRSRVEGFDVTLDEWIEVWRHYLAEEMPDVRTTITEIVASGDRVAFMAINEGTSAIYGQSAVWTECDFLRLENGNIVESWGVEDLQANWRQLGFRIEEPATQVPRGDQ